MSASYGQAWTLTYCPASAVAVEVAGEWPRRTLATLMARPVVARLLRSSGNRLDVCRVGYKDRVHIHPTLARAGNRVRRATILATAVGGAMMAAGLLLGCTNGPSSQYQPASSQSAQSLSSPASTALNRPR